VERAPRLVLVGEAESGTAAVVLIDRLAPAVVFLDVQMPECTGLEVLERAAHRPAPVFTTAYPEYALRAFAHIVNLDHVSAIRPYDERRLSVRFADGSEVVASRAGSRSLREMVR
jgi:DNA-binding LytR/AlgR family response regulator